MSSPQLFLIRHGETEWTLAGRHTGHTDLALTPRGAEQARDLAPWLQGRTFTAVLSSPAARALQTCACALPGSEPEIVPDLAEWNYGDYEGRRTVDIRKDRADWNLWRDGCPNGESPLQLGARVDRLLRRLEALQGDVVLFSHGHFGPALAARWIGLPVSDGQRFTLSPASLSVLAEPADLQGVRAIALWNQVPADLATCSAGPQVAASP